MADSLGHEMYESVTDPSGDGWHGLSGMISENGDFCRSIYLPTQTSWDKNHVLNTMMFLGRNVSFNQIIGNYPYILQTMWNPTLNTTTGYQTGCI